MTGRPAYVVVPFNDAKQVYRELTADYWNFIYEVGCDKKNDKGYVTFLREDSIGGERKPDDKPFKQNIEIHEGSNIFFPVYQVHVCECDPHPKGGTCDGIDRCMEAAYDDLSQIERIYAEIEENNGGRKPIVKEKDLYNHRVTLAPFTLKVPHNELKREPKYHLNPGVYDGVVKGTYMFLKNFQKGKYVIYFGGKAKNYETHSEYTVNVI
jgi:hypothetical protein